MNESHRLLGTLFKNKKKPMSALDCGGGIGSIISYKLKRNIQGFTIKMVQSSRSEWLVLGIYW